MIEIRRILCPVDFSDNSMVAVNWARDLASRFEAELHFLHVLISLEPLIPEAGTMVASSSEFGREMKLDAERRLDELVSNPNEIGALGRGTPFVEIVRYARENAVDLIVAATHGRSGLSHLLLGSVAEKVIRKAPCPVLTVRPEGMRFEMP